MDGVTNKTHAASATATQPVGKKEKGPIHAARKTPRRGIMALISADGLSSPARVETFLVRETNRVLDPLRRPATKEGASCPAAERYPGEDLRPCF
ncbi:MAG: hypothetical protein ACI915_001646 [Gammaproteobacteria bacterium]|jgi:hypothetical protein